MEHGFSFDGTINLGQVLLIAGWVGGFAFFALSLRFGLSDLAGRMLKVEKKLDSLNEILIQMAKQETRMDSFDKQVAALMDQMGRMVVIPPIPRR